MDKNDYKFGEDMIMSDMLVVNSAYIDIEFVKYIQLGEILSHENLTQALYTDIASVMKNDTFKQRYTDDVSLLLRDVSNIKIITNTESKRSDDIKFGVSPSFDNAITVIRNCLMMSGAAKRLAKSNTSTKLSVDVSVLPDISTTMCQRIADEYSSTFEEPVSVLRKPFTKENITDLLEFDIFFVSNLARFNEIAVDLMDAGRLISKHFVCSKLLPLGSTKPIDDKVMPRVFLNIQCIMTAATDFHWVEPFSLT